MEESGEGQPVTSCTVIGATLGAVSAILLLALVGMVMGWVWFCHRDKGKSEERCENRKSSKLMNTAAFYPLQDYRDRA